MSRLKEKCNVPNLETENNSKGLNTVTSVPGPKAPQILHILCLEVIRILSELKLSSAAVLPF